MSREESEGLAKRIESRLKLGKLDSLFLFVPTLLGIGFSLFQYYLGIIKEPSAMIALMPILIVGIGMPVYIGYYRGGIKLDSMIERARGWIYLVGGAGNYIALMAVAIAAVSLPVVFALPYFVLVFVIMVLASCIALRIGFRIATLFGERISFTDCLALVYTVLSSSLLGLTLVTTFHPSRGLLNATREFWKIPTDETWYLPLTVANLVSGILISLWFEQWARAPTLRKETVLWVSAVVGVMLSGFLFSSIPQSLARMFPQHTRILFISAIVLGASVPTFTYAVLRHYYTRK